MDDNLTTALHGEAFAYVKYLHYAEKAEESGNMKLGKVYRAVANEEWHHFGQLAKFTNLISDDLSNLKEAIKGEIYEAKTMYPRFAADAEMDSQPELAQRYRELARDEQRHADLYKAVLKEEINTRSVQN